LVLIFLLTIFLPSVTLSIFGLIALRNERYRVEQQFRENQLELIDSVKTAINNHIGELENELQYIVRTPSLINKDYLEINTLVEKHLEEHHLSGQFFVAFDGNEPWFPPFRGQGSGYIPIEVKGFSSLQKQKIEQAENYEFIQNDFQGAILLLEELLKTTEDQSLRGQLLNRIARNHMKQNNFNDAISIYTEIIQNIPDARTSSGTLLPVTVRLQLIECYLRSSLKEDALKETLQAFKGIIMNSSNLSENQFIAYGSLVREKFNSILDEYPELNISDTALMNEFENFDNSYQEIVDKWEVINILKNECITELSEEFRQSSEYTTNTLRYSKKIGVDDFLIISSQIPDETEKQAQGIAGIKINNTFLEDSILAALIKNADWNAADSINVTDMTGRVILGYKTISPNADKIISLFDDNFPPWRIEVSVKQTRPFLFKAIFNSYYFWTILAMMAILGFGVVIIGRMIAHEKEILKLKQDFVSSVSHEFKTPITSIKALSERLLEGNVKDHKRMEEYYTVIAQDAENLSHLVGNILDFSKIEEGKKEYNFEKTNIKEWLDNTLADFFSKQPERIRKIRTVMGETDVPVYMDRGAMKLAINNLLDNAVKFSSAQTEITITLEQQQQQYLLHIKDEGIGIPLEEQSKIFEKFYRGKHASNHAATGTGLGLAIVKQIVEAHGGEVRVESGPDSGSQFKIILPLKPPTEN